MDIDNLVKNMGLVDAFAETMMPDHVLANKPVCGDNCVSCTYGCSTGCFNTASA
jgi:hypothetical protein